LFTTRIRVEGEGKWLRTRHGEWELEHFTAAGFAVVNTEKTLRQTIEDLRAIPAKWKDLDDPLGELMAIRRGTDG
jgi:hypothetical protein